MSVAPVIQKYLDERDVAYQVQPHELAYTSQEVAAAREIPGREMAKSVILRADGCLVMGLIPASHVVRLDRLKEAIGCHKLRLACEHEFEEAFFGCETGAAAPFGEIWDVPVFCDRSLADQREIEFNAGTHTDTIRMRVSDFKSLAHPRVADFSARRKHGEPLEHSAS